jgi:hypothetical protein
VRDQVLHSYETTGRIRVLYILTFALHSYRADGKTIYSEPNASKYSPNLVCSLSLPACNFYPLVLFPNILTLPHLQTTRLLSLCYAFVLPSDNVTLTYN